MLRRGTIRNDTAISRAARHDRAPALQPPWYGPFGGVLDLKQFGLHTVLIGIAFALFARRYLRLSVLKLEHRRRQGPCPLIERSLHVKLERRMLMVLALDGPPAMLLEVHHVGSGNEAPRRQSSDILS